MYLRGRHNPPSLDIRWTRATRSLAGSRTDFRVNCLFEEVTLTPPRSGEPCVISKNGDRTWNKVGEVTMEQIEEIAKIKLPDLNTNKLQSAMNTVMGTAKNMGSACYALYNLQLLPPAM